MSLSILSEKKKKKESDKISLALWLFFPSGQLSARKRSRIVRASLSVVATYDMTLHDIWGHGPSSNGIKVSENYAIIEHIKNDLANLVIVKL